MATIENQFLVMKQLQKQMDLQNRILRQATFLPPSPLELLATQLQQQALALQPSLLFDQRLSSIMDGIAFPLTQLSAITALCTNKMDHITRNLSMALESWNSLTATLNFNNSLAFNDLMQSVSKSHWEPSQSAWAALESFEQLAPSAAFLTVETQEMGEVEPSKEPSTAPLNNFKKNAKTFLLAALFIMQGFNATHDFFVNIGVLPFNTVQPTQLAGCSAEMPLIIEGSQISDEIQEALTTLIEEVTSCLYTTKILDKPHPNINS